MAVRAPFPGDIRGDIRAGPLNLGGLLLTVAAGAGGAMAGLLLPGGKSVTGLLVWALVPAGAAFAVSALRLPVWARRAAGYLRRIREGRGQEPGEAAGGAAARLAKGDFAVFAALSPPPWETMPEAAREACVAAWQGALRLAAAGGLRVGVFLETMPDDREEEFARHEAAALRAGGGLERIGLARATLWRQLAASGMAMRVYQIVRVSGLPGAVEALEAAGGVLGELRRAGEVEVLAPDLVGMPSSFGESAARGTRLARRMWRLPRTPGWARASPAGGRAWIGAARSLPSLLVAAGGGLAQAASRVRAALKATPHLGRRAEDGPAARETGKAGAGGGQSASAAGAPEAGRASLVGVVWHGSPGGVPERLALLLGGMLVQWRPRFVDVPVERRVLAAHPEAAAGALSVLREAAPPGRVLVLELGNADDAPAELARQCDLLFAVSPGEPGREQSRAGPALRIRPPASWAEWALLAATVSDALLETTPDRALGARDEGRDGAPAAPKPT